MIRAGSTLLSTGFERLDETRSATAVLFEEDGLAFRGKGCSDVLDDDERGGGFTASGCDDVDDGTSGITNSLCETAIMDCTVLPKKHSAAYVHSSAVQG